MKSPDAVTLRFASKPPVSLASMLTDLVMSVLKKEFLNGIEYFNNEVDEDEK
ncbi:hypothetical protein [Bacillus sp. EB01]|uniref:hypothetical protein n=1 Tax=Bacillus sp. EB01 TaxID=1347086 RepID=UPI000AD88A85|nr:hypothetical protein [Bacillus sp. EB01]